MQSSVGVPEQVVFVLPLLEPSTPRTEKQLHRMPGSLPQRRWRRCLQRLQSCNRFRRWPCRHCSQACRSSTVGTPAERCKPSHRWSHSIPRTFDEFPPLLCSAAAPTNQPNRPNHRYWFSRLPRPIRELPGLWRFLECLLHGRGQKPNQNRRILRTGRRRDYPKQGAKPQYVAATGIALEP